MIQGDRGVLNQNGRVTRFPMGNGGFGVLDGLWEVDRFSQCQSAAHQECSSQCDDFYFHETYLFALSGSKDELRCGRSLSSQLRGATPDPDPQPDSEGQRIGFQ
jgi:hypothetical protein